MFFSKSKLIYPSDDMYGKHGLNCKQLVENLTEMLTEANVPYTISVDTETDSQYNVNIILYDRIRINLFNSGSSVYTYLFNALSDSTSNLMYSSYSPFYNSYGYNYELGVLVTDVSVSIIIGSYVRPTDSAFHSVMRSNLAFTVFPFIRDITNDEFLTFGFANVYGSNASNLGYTSFSMSWLPDPNGYSSASWSFGELYNTSYDKFVISDCVHKDGVHYMPNMIRFANGPLIVGKFSDGANTYLGWGTVAVRID